MTSSFNAFGKTQKVYDACHVPVWLGDVTRVPVGGSLASDFVKKGVLIPAGTPINITNKVITPLVAFEVVSFTAGDTNDILVIKPCTYGMVDFLPKADDVIQVLGATFATAKKAAVVTAIAAGSTAGQYNVTIAHSATIDTPSAGDHIVFSSATAAGSSKVMANQPNAYLFNDICLGDIDETLEGAGASGAAVKFHAEGLLIQRTPGADFAEALAVAIPGVLQVNG